MQASLQPLEGIRSVLFDIYGTLLVSLQGESPGGSGRLERDSMVAALLGSGLMPPDQEHSNSIGEVAGASRGGDRHSGSRDPLVVERSRREAVFRGHDPPPHGK
jgi:hypothetical protein